MRDQLIWKVATAGTLAVIALMSSAPGAAVSQPSPKLALCPAPLVGTTWSTRTFGSSACDHGCGIAVEPRYDTRGVRTWTVQFGSADCEHVDGVAADGGGDDLAGDFRISINGSAAVGLRDLFAASYDGAGTVR